MLIVALANVVMLGRESAGPVAVTVALSILLFWIWQHPAALTFGVLIVGFMIFVGYRFNIGNVDKGVILGSVFPSISLAGIILFGIGGDIETAPIERRRIEQARILYIVLDSYPGASTLADYYEYDNSEFYADLVQLNYEVNTDLITNYPRTVLTLHAVLNGAYLERDDTNEDTHVKALFPTLKNNALFRGLKAEGYQIINLNNWWEGTRENPLALNLDFTGNQYSEFQIMLLAPLESLGLGIQNISLESKHRQTALFQFDYLSTQLDTLPARSFVFAHILLPHGPIVFPEVAPDTDAAFIGQLVETNRMLLDALALVQEDYIVIIHSDEGPFPEGTEQAKGNTYGEQPPEFHRVRQTGMLATRNFDYTGRTPINIGRQLLGLAPIAERVFIVEDYRRPLSLIEYNGLLERPTVVDIEFQ